MAPVFLALWTFLTGGPPPPLFYLRLIISECSGLRHEPMGIGIPQGPGPRKETNQGRSVSQAGGGGSMCGQSAHPLSQGRMVRRRCTVSKLRYTRCATVRKLQPNRHLLIFPGYQTPPLFRAAETMGVGCLRFSGTVVPPSAGSLPLYPEEQDAQRVEHSATRHPT